MNHEERKVLRWKKKKKKKCLNSDFWPLLDLGIFLRDLFPYGPLTNLEIPLFSVFVYQKIWPLGCFFFLDFPDCARTEIGYYKMQQENA